MTDSHLHQIPQTTPTSLQTAKPDSTMQFTDQRAAYVYPSPSISIAAMDHQNHGCPHSEVTSAVTFATGSSTFAPISPPPDARQVVFNNIAMDATIAGLTQLCPTTSLLPDSQYQHRPMTFLESEFCSFPISTCTGVHSYAYANSPSNIYPFCWSSPIADNLPRDQDVGSRFMEDGPVSAPESPSIVRPREDPYSQLIYRAFMSQPTHSMTLQQLYQWFRENTERAKTATKGWQNSIRYNLSVNKVRLLAAASGNAFG